MLGQSGRGSDGNKEVLCFSQSSSITGIRLFSVISRTLVGGGLTSLQRCSWCILQQGKAMSIEGKLWIQTSFTILKIWPYIISCLSRKNLVNPYMAIISKDFNHNFFFLARVSAKISNFYILTHDVLKRRKIFQKGKQEKISIVGLNWI